MALESEAVFVSWITKLGLELFMPKFKELGWATAGEFVFASSYTPGHPNPEKFDEEVVAKLFVDNGGAQHPKRAAVRRL